MTTPDFLRSDDGNLVLGPGAFAVLAGVPVQDVLDAHAAQLQQTGAPIEVAWPDGWMAQAKATVARVCDQHGVGSVVEVLAILRAEQAPPPEDA